MTQLDPRTVDRLAEVIVDIGGPYERKGYELEALLQRARWEVTPIYDGSPRVEWLRDQLEARQEYPGEVERLLCRVCDPIEYDDGVLIAEEIRAAVNERLAPEHLAITLVSGRPVLGAVQTAGQDPTFAEPPDLQQRLAALVSDQETVHVLMGRVEETRICVAGGAYRMATIGIGTFIEGLLLAVLLERDEDLRRNGFPDVRRRTLPGKRDPNKRTSADWVSLELLIDTAYDKNWVQLDATAFAHAVRDFRNFIHPRKEITEQPRFDADTVMLCWGPVQALMNDLEQNLPPLP
ncbi:hypothetical protein [Nocardia terpenica]|uniref:Uncharacterized protein n=1 Tax=Nocardia terpenica TaxID=455432 RepID=A0A164PGY4_9NOCA|nr:hypothetical protein [Nocardia terpenica]KZM75556.1 hypothetical protein AWN90_19460 [Nocardia terpenica]NQE86036.1 hypothetical protein [Nocardia terpenica]